ncbi:DUF6934 family protein [Paraflavitalea pollutisoli]|uniref:DUF6934 family protein n=1 Tax=Paraflavitalea pollutisoli TaxID=3034143 RepID=UPI0023EAD1A3|nr:hypothetical protein [Paraflavitalea sp. H1-2-19X]
MTNSEHCYLFQEKLDNENASYYFVSNGYRRLLKVVQYTYVGINRERPTYNFGFGTLNLDNGTLQDMDISANGDAYKVFNTVLNTVLDFLKRFPGAMIMVEGSDSNTLYPDLCWLTCNKNCAPPHCRNQHRRIKLYKSFLNKNYDLLSKEYQFCGGVKNTHNEYVMEEYRRNNNYESIFFIQKQLANFMI